MSDEYRHLGPNEAIEEGDVLPDTVAPMGESSYSEDGSDINLTDRFAVTPLYTEHYKHALVGEYLCDPNTGAPAMVRPNGHVVSIHEISRLHQHIEEMTQNLCYCGMRMVSIYNLLPTDESKVSVYDYENMLTEQVLIEMPEETYSLEKIVLSIDLSIVKSIDTPFLQVDGLDPVIQVTYYTNGIVENTTTIEMKLSNLKLSPIEFRSPVKSFTITKIVAPEITEDAGYECFIHSILFAYV